jgi:hypothetical protein
MNKYILLGAFTFLFCFSVSLHAEIQVVTENASSQNVAYIKTLGHSVIREQLDISINSETPSATFVYTLIAEKGQLKDFLLKLLEKSNYQVKMSDIGFWAWLMPSQISPVVKLTSLSFKNEREPAKQLIVIIQGETMMQHHYLNQNIKALPQVSFPTIAYLPNPTPSAYGTYSEDTPMFMPADYIDEEHIITVSYHFESPDAVREFDCSGRFMADKTPSYSIYFDTLPDEKEKTIRTLFSFKTKAPVSFKSFTDDLARRPYIEIWKNPIFNHYRVTLADRGAGWSFCYENQWLGYEPFHNIMFSLDFQKNNMKDKEENVIEVVNFGLSVGSTSLYELEDYINTKGVEDRRISRTYPEKFAFTLPITYAWYFTNPWQDTETYISHRDYFGLGVQGQWYAYKDQMDDMNSLLLGYIVAGFYSFMDYGLDFLKDKDNAAYARFYGELLLNPTNNKYHQLRIGAGMYYW